MGADGEVGHDITIYPNGTFPETSSSFINSRDYNPNQDYTLSGEAYSDGADRGRVVKHGTTLSFQYDTGKIWNADYEMDGTGDLKLNGSYYLRQ